MKAIRNAIVLEFVPTEPTRASEILREILEAGHVWRLSYKNHNRKKETKSGMVRSLAQRLNGMPGVRSIASPDSTMKLYYRGVG